MDPKVLPHAHVPCECIFLSIELICPEDSPWNWDLLWKRSVSKEQQITRSFETKKEDFHSLMVHTHKAPFYNPYDLVQLPLHSSQLLLKLLQASAAAMVPLQRRTFEETGGARLNLSTPNYGIPKTPEGKRVTTMLLVAMFGLLSNFCSDLFFQERQKESVHQSIRWNTRSRHHRWCQD
jgi:hypothetical protein